MVYPFSDFALPHNADYVVVMKTLKDSVRRKMLYMSDEKGPVSECTYQLMSAAFNCINTMEKDLAEVVKNAEKWEDAATRHEQEIIRLHESFDRRGIK